MRRSLNEKKGIVRHVYSKKFLEVFILIFFKVNRAVSLCMAAWTDCETVKGIQDGKSFCVFVDQEENFNKNWAVRVYLFMSAFLPCTLLMEITVYKDTSLTLVMSPLEHVGHWFALCIPKKPEGNTEVCLGHMITQFYSTIALVYSMYS